MSVHHAFWAALLVVCSFVRVSSAQGRAPLFPAIFIFGDSLVDVGNNNYILLALAKANLPPNGIDFITHRPTGRFCNGKTVLDILCDYINLPYPPPVEAPSSRGSAILRGVNFASGAGGILDGTGANYLRINEFAVMEGVNGGQPPFTCYFMDCQIERLSFNAQLDLFQQTISDLNAQLGAAGTTDLIGRSLFAFAFGSNDYINNYLLSNSSSRAQYSPFEYQSLLISTYRTQLTSLYNQGVRKFAVSNVGPLGCIPSRLAVGSTDGSCVAFDNSLVVGFNTALRALLIDLGNALSGSRFLYANPYDAFFDLVHNPAPQGFTVVNQGCCGGGRYHGQIPCLPVVDSLCPNRNQYLFWDPFHPTQAVNEILGRRLFSGPPSDVYPINVEQLSRL